MVLISTPQKFAIASSGTRSLLCSPLIQMYIKAKASEIVRWFQTIADPYHFPRYFVSAAFAASQANSFPQPVQKYRCSPGTSPVPLAQD